MEALKSFLQVSSGSGSGSGSGYGFGDGSGDGSGYGDGYGYGDGSGDGSGDGYGDGYGDGAGIKRFCGKDVYIIDGVQTIIDHVRGNVAHCRIINDDFTTEKCFVAKSGNLFAHGETLKDAMSALREKLLDGMSEEERVAEFLKSHNAKDTYTVRDLYEWHHVLTGSCEMGRKQFAKEHGLLDMDNTRLTVKEFIDLTRNAYGGSVIRLLEERYKARLDGGKW